MVSNLCDSVVAEMMVADFTTRKMRQPANGPAAMMMSYSQIPAFVQISTFPGECQHAEQSFTSQSIPSGI
jgi:hypothetical protein